MAGGINRDGDRYRIGPLTTYEDPNRFERLFAAARPGDLVEYAWGPALGRDAVLKRRADELAEAGHGSLHVKRTANGLTYVILKQAAPPAEAASASNASVPFRPGSPEARLLAVVASFAEAGKALPSLDLLAERAGLPRRQSAAYRLKRLVEGGFVTLREDGDRRFASLGGQS